jgi:hypothetical protein
VTSLKPVFAVLMIVLVAVGCTGHVEVPREEFEAATHDEFQSHRIRTKTTEYIAHRFSFTDSTLVITQLAPADTRYRLERPPFVISRGEIESISGVKDNMVAPVVAIGIGLGLVATIAALSGGSWFGN